jgi:lipopolysaccharide/colanic/teichoic acid biosynthesis glycosyltransferase
MKIKLVISNGVKRLFDIISSTIVFVLTSPIFLYVVYLIKKESPGPIFYKAQRIGKSGKPFTMYKFRTMVVNADKIGGPSTAADDPRLTKIGLFLKKYQLDELPQLINVINGDMSVVGPRPEVKVYVDMMTDEEKNVILSVRPGITDLASLWNFHEAEILKGSPDPEKTYMEKIRPEKLRLQKEYVRKASFFLDMDIIFKTIAKIFK